MIRNVRARKILNSRGQETIEVTVESADSVGTAAAPTGASTGSAEPVAFPKGVDAAVAAVNTTVAHALRGLNAGNQKEIDSKLLSLDIKKIGASATIAVSLAVAKAAARGHLWSYLNPQATKFPYPLGNVVGGGAHGGGTDIQEFLLIPLGAKTISEAVFTNAEIHRKVGELLAKGKGWLRARNDEGGWVTTLDTRAVLETITKAIDSVAPRTRIGLDVAATELWDGKRYVYRHEGVYRTTEQQEEYLLKLAKRYPIVYIEDPFHEKDFVAFASFTGKFKGLTCGDDIFVTQGHLLARGISERAANSLIIKPNQNGTLSSTLEVIQMAREARYKVILSHRSGETPDTTISHLALASEAELIKTGIVGGERIAKLNELIRLWDEVKSPSMSKVL